MRPSVTLPVALSLLFLGCGPTGTSTDDDDAVDCSYPEGAV